MSRTFRTKPYSHFRRIATIFAEYKDPELTELGYAPRSRHRWKLSSWDDLAHSTYIPWNFR
jgi:hypothetical protein